MIVLSMLTTLCALAAAPAGQLAFVAGTNQEDQTVTVLDFGTEVQRPVGPGRRDGAPHWSPNGEWLTFESQVEGGLGIFIAAAEGGSVRMLPTAHNWNFDPRWSTDGCRRAVCAQNICGRYLIYSSDVGEGIQHELMVYDLQAEEESAWGGGATGLRRPAWLPTIGLARALQAEQIEWEGVDTAQFMEELQSVGGILAIQIVASNETLGTELVLVTQSHAVPLLALITEDEDRYHEWAVVPDRLAQRMAFESTRGGDREVFVLHRRGLTNVSNHRAADWNPVWSPTGNWLAFESFRSGRRGVYRVFPDTALVEVIDASPIYSAWAPTWSPGGDWIAYVSDATGTPQIHLRDPKGRNPRQLTEAPGYHVAPAWRPEVR